MSTAREAKRSTNALRKVNINLFENYILNMITDQSILICVFLAKLQKAVKEGEILKENPSCLTFVPPSPPHHHSGKYNGTRSGSDVCIKDPLSGRCYTCRPLISWHNNICPLMFDIHSSDWKRYTVPNLTSEYVR